MGFWKWMGSSIKRQLKYYLTKESFTSIELEVMSGMIFVIVSIVVLIGELAEGGVFLLYELLFFLFLIIVGILMVIHCYYRDRVVRHEV